MSAQAAVQPQFDDSPAVPLWWGALSAAAMILTLYLIFDWVSTEATMGIVQRIFYFHVPAAIASFTASFVGGIASIMYLVKRDNRYDDLSLAANESVVLFAMVNIVMGSLWAKPIWGIWWTWDARLTSSFLLLFLYAAYLVIRQAAPVEQRAVVCAVICILGMADVPLIYLSNRLFRTQHPAPVIGGDANSGLAPDMLKLFVIANVTMLIFWGLVVRTRRRVARLERAAEDLTRRINELSDTGV
ncbi:MAG TPA: cytochrome c biogenesis protein CcsA [Candidatus Sulfopaludibacter sp.]|nr:cytochrome c biogenesis protein CcsA [Candidatus Sulfopaludibacter sp.]